MLFSIKAPAKINIGLDVVRKRPDGYHDLKMIMQTIDIYDTLSFEIFNEENIQAVVEFSCSNPALSDPESNLVVKAIRMIADEFETKDTIKVHLDKNIPVAAGMAGGSTDAAAAFIAMNTIYDLGLKNTDLMKRAVIIGADIPFCIMKGTALCEGIGDIITPMKSFSSDISILVVKPDIDISTGFVYGNLKLTPRTVHPDIDGIISAIESDDYISVGNLLGNVLEDVSIPAYPVIDSIKDTMLSYGALGSIMSGSGPTVFGFYLEEDAAKDAAARCRELFPGSFIQIAHAV